MDRRGDGECGRLYEGAEGTTAGVYTHTPADVYYYIC